MHTGNYRYLPIERVRWGVPAGEAVAREAALRASARIVVVASRSLNRNTSAVREATAQVADRVAGVFDECVEHTPRESVIALVGLLRETQADLVVTLGGGTAIDTVKVALLGLALDVREVADLDRCHVRVAADGSREVPRAGPPPLRQIAVPTTLSGAEFSDMAGCTDRARGVKHGYTGPQIGPAAVILDPAITLHTPARLWLSTGIRSVDHAIESLCSINAQPLTDATCLRALELFARALPRNREAPEDLEARLESQLAVWLATSGIGRTDYGASHGIGHVLGAAAGVPHGITSCVMLPAVLRYNAGVTAPAQARIAAAFARPGEPADTVVRDWIAALGLPVSLSEIGVGRERFAEIAEKSMSNQWVRTNPRPIAEPAQVLAILQDAL